MNLLEQPQVVCKIKLWYQLFFRGHFRVGGVVYGITRKIEVCVHNWQYLCQYSISFNDSCTKTLCF